MIAASSFPVPPQLLDAIPVLIALLTLVAFLPILKNSFVDWDNFTLVNNPSYRGLGLRELQWVFASFHFGQYQPLLWLTFALDYILWWMDPFGYHWSSLVVHVGSAFVFYHVAYRLLSLSQRARAPLEITSARIAAALATLAFAVHPLRIEPVAWASGRGEVLSGFFVLVSAYYYLVAKSTAQAPGGPTARCMRLSVGAYVASLMAGAAGIMLPIALLILDGYPLRRSRGLPNPFRSETRQLYLEKAYYFAAMLAFGVVNIVAEKFRPTIEAPYDAQMLSWLFHQLAAPAFYLCKGLMPIALSPAYELSVISLILYVVAGILISAAVIVVRKKSPALCAAWFCYLVFLLPVFRAEFPVQQSLADRYAYLPGVSLTLFTAIVVWEFLKFGGSKIFASWLRPLTSGVGVVLLILLGVLARLQIPLWQNAESMWRSAITASPSSEAYFQLAAISEAQGKHDDALAFYKRAAELDPRRWDAHEQAGLLLQKQGKIAEAVEHYRKVVQSKPGALDTRENLAAALVNLGHVAEAAQHFRKLLELAPERNENRVKLGTILAVQGHAVEATGLFTAAAKADPTDSRISLRLGQLLAAQGKLAEAVHYFREAARLSSEDAEAHESLGRALSELGKNDEAARHLREAIRILRSTPAAH